MEPVSSTSTHFQRMHVPAGRDSVCRLVFPKVGITVQQHEAGVSGQLGGICSGAILMHAQRLRQPAEPVVRRPAKVTDARRYAAGLHRAVPDPHFTCRHTLRRRRPDHPELQDTGLLERKIVGKGFSPRSIVNVLNKVRLGRCHKFHNTRTNCWKDEDIWVLLVRLLASHRGKLGSIPIRVTPGFSHVRIVPGDATGRRVFAGISLLEHFTPVQSLALRGDWALGARGRVALSLPCFSATNSGKSPSRAQTRVSLLAVRVCVLASPKGTSACPSTISPPVVRKQKARVPSVQRKSVWTSFAVPEGSRRDHLRRRSRDPTGVNRGMEQRRNTAAGGNGRYPRKAGEITWGNLLFTKLARGRGSVVVRLPTSLLYGPVSIPGCDHSRIFACGNRAGRCRWSARFLGDLPFPLSLHSGAAHTTVTLIDSLDLAVKSRPNPSTPRSKDSDRPIGDVGAGANEAGNAGNDVLGATPEEVGDIAVATISTGVPEVITDVE
ncbi:hypothetical protein PR048_012172 [Dryococelus australis]|uniref:Uncharacterized protein n=1 Tax=Dryococelus australis TaxID=614101 RepID=A0ABQ9HPC7_9NEOP|nr:hypothetical protein PR048_012172 [Dryococelus australis]